jgi:hypothetical protein
LAAYRRQGRLEAELRRRFPDGSRKSIKRLAGPRPGLKALFHDNAAARRFVEDRSAGDFELHPALRKAARRDREALRSDAGA